MANQNSDRPAAIVDSTASTSEDQNSPGWTTIDIECSDDNGESDSFTSPNEAWPAQYDYCDATVTGSTLSPLEQHALQTAYGSVTGFDELGSLYSLCAQSGRKSLSVYGGAPTKAQAKELAGTLDLCPSHPDKKAIKKLIGAGATHDRLQADGRVFGSGTYRVGKQIKAGTYVSFDPSEGCYWERQDRNGEIIDNYFSPGALRVQVTIRSSDYGFNSDRCGEWRPENN